MISVSGHNLDVVQEPRMVVTVSLLESISKKRKRRRRSSSTERTYSGVNAQESQTRVVPDADCSGDPQCSTKKVCVSVCGLYFCPLHI